MVRSCLLVLCVSLAAARREDFQRPYAPCDNPEWQHRLDAETALMPMVAETVVNIPFDILKGLFVKPETWSTWNSFVSNVQTTSFKLCEPFHADFFGTAAPFHRDFQPAGHQTIVRVEDTDNLFQLAWTYHVKDNEGETAIFGKHSTSIFRYDGSEDKTVFYTWEKATGYEIRYAPEAISLDWGVVVQRSLAGMKCLEQVYAETGALDPEAFAPGRNPCQNIVI